MRAFHATIEGMTIAIKLMTAVMIAAMLMLGGDALHEGVTSAQVFQGPGLEAGLNQAIGVTNVPYIVSPRQAIVHVLTEILDYAALIAVAMVIIAGFYLILSLGEDEKRDKAKKIIFYTLIGLLVLLFARIIVGLVTVVLYEALP
jgi:hypothetical protein